MQAIADGLTDKKFAAQLAKWRKILPQPFATQDLAAGYRYEVSILQSEFSLAQVLNRPQSGRVFFESVIREKLPC